MQLIDVYKRQPQRSDQYGGSRSNHIGKSISELKSHHRGLTGDTDYIRKRSGTGLWKKPAARRSWVPSCRSRPGRPVRASARWIPSSKGSRTRFWMNLARVWSSNWAGITWTASSVRTTNKPVDESIQNRKDWNAQQHPHNTEHPAADDHGKDNPEGL